MTFYNHWNRDHEDVCQPLILEQVLNLRCTELGLKIKAHSPDIFGHQQINVGNMLQPKTRVVEGEGSSLPKKCKTLASHFLQKKKVDIKTLYLAQQTIWEKNILIV